jgi:16S rRNA (guanine966-N2)-methyltransferase
MNIKLKITGGSLFGKQFHAPNISNLTKAPGNKLRKTIFSSIRNIKNARILDLFAGSGSYSFEAISRGAKNSILIEKNTKITSCIKNNVKILNLFNSCKIYTINALNFIPKKKINLI